MVKKWWKESVAYQIYPKSFYDTNGDGVGDLNGILAKLDYLASLGVDLIWISPIYQSPMADNGYDISDYYKIDPIFGTNEELDELIGEAAKRHIRIMMDLVINHTSDEHEWFQKAKQDIQGPYGQYYIFKEGVAGGPPNNWRSLFGNSAWEPVEGTNFYYLHTFAVKQPDLNWENSFLRSQLYQMVNYWLDRGLGGFRVDAITFIKKDVTFQNYPADGLDGLVNMSTVSLNQPGIEVFLNELKECTFDRYDCITVAEAPGVPYSDLGAYIGEKGFFNMIFDFSYADMDLTNGEWFKPTNWTVKELRDLVYASQLAVEAAGWGATYLESHDQPRAIYKYLKAENRHYYGATLLATLYFMLRGTPFIYQGQELGMRNAERSDISQFDDISTLDQYQRALEFGLSAEEALYHMNQRSRDHGRTPFQWNGELHAGFTTGEPWLSVPDTYKIVNLEQQLQDEQSILSFYKQLIQLRKHSEYAQTIVYGQFKPVLLAYENLFAYERILNDQTILVLCNYCEEPLTIENCYDVKETLINNYKQLAVCKEVIGLQAFQCVVLAINGH